MGNVWHGLSSVQVELRRYWLTNLVLLLVAGLVMWVAIGDLSERGEEEEGEERPAAVTTAIIGAGEIGKADWRVGAIRATPDAEAYEVTVVSEAGEPIFRFKVDALQAHPLGKEDERLEEASQPVPKGAVPLTLEAVRQSVTALLPQLETGLATRKGREPFFKVPITYEEVKIAEVRVDVATGQVMLPAEKAPPTGEREEEREEAEKLKIVPRNLVLPIGYLSALVAVVSALYYSWKRELYAPMRAISGEAKAKAIAGLHQTLTLHIVAGIAALALAVLHVLNFMHKLHLTISWLTLAMMVTVVLSGAFGKYLARTEMVRHHWRRFHVPYTVLFFLTLLLHVLMKIHVFGD